MILTHLHVSQTLILFMNFMSLTRHESMHNYFLLYKLKNLMTQKYIQDILIYTVIIEPAHDKTTKMTFASSEDSDQPGHLPSLISLCCACE